jgi:MerR family transcriptional regulator, redox-sensitive transcriptional activator SoxR
MDVDEILLPIDQVAGKAGLASSALRYYERCGLIGEGQKIGGRRHYPPSVLRRLSTIRVCQTLGFSLAEIGELLDGSGDGEAWRTLSKVRRAEVQSQIQQLQSLLEVLNTAVECCCPDLGDCPEMSPEGRLASVVPEPEDTAERAYRPPHRVHRPRCGPADPALRLRGKG